MLFLIDYNRQIEEVELLYVLEDYSFICEPVSRWEDFTILVNNLNLTVLGEENKIIEVWGFCGLGIAVETNHNPPSNRRGILKTVEELPTGTCYRIVEAPVFVNPQTAWVCIGDPEKQGEAVEFIPNAVMVLDETMAFISLWLKPKIIPSLA